jgi:tetratricopeptide (TPR) repeat protein
VTDWSRPPESYPTVVPPDGADWIPAPAPGSPGGSPATDVGTLDSPSLPATHVSAGTSPTDPVAPGPPAETASLVAGYEILDELGKGGMGIVFKARQVRLDRIVALKMMLTHGPFVRADDRRRFRTEAEAVARLHHPNIVQIFEVGDHRGMPFFSLEFCPGGTLDAQLDGTPWDGRRAAALIHTLAEAVQHAHEHGIVHRDLKPANVLLAEDGTPKISDFGLAKKIDEEGHTRTGAIMGTPGYMAPEQAGGHVGDIGPGTDIFALGAMLYELLTGRPPFRAATVMDTVQQVLHNDPVAPRALQPGTPRDLETVCLKCLEKEPRKRYGSARELADDLRHFLRDEPIRARPAGRVERVVRWCRRRPAVAALCGVILAAVLAGVGAVPWHVGRLRGALDQAQAQRREEVRAAARGFLRQGEEALERKDLRQARDSFVQADSHIGDEDAEADGGLDVLRGDARRRLGEMDARDRARKDYEAFFPLRDEALFLLYRDAVTGEDTGGARESEAKAREALGRFGLPADPPREPDLGLLAPEEQKKLREGLYETMLVLAEALVRPRPGQESAGRRRQVEEAVHLLVGARLLAPSPETIRARRARYLGEPAAPAANGAAPHTALDWFFGGVDRLFVGGDPAGAVGDFDRAINAQRDLFWAHFFRGCACQKVDNLKGAHTSFTICAQLRPAFPWTFLLRGFLDGQLKDFAEARADFRRAEQLPLDPWERYTLHNNRGYVALAQGDAAAAVGDLAEAVKLRPQLYNARLNLAEAYARSKELEWAATAWACSGATWAAAATWYARIQELDRAVAEMGEALRLQPGRASLYRSRARLHFRREDRAAALHDLEEAIRLEQAGTPSAALLGRDHLERAQVLHQVGRNAEALAGCVAALCLLPNDPAVHRLHGEVLLRLHRHAEALAAFDRFLEHQGRPDVAFYRARARARVRVGDYRGVIEDYTEALKLDPQHPDADLYALRGWAYEVNDAVALARKDFERALKLNPRHADAAVGLAFVRVRQGDWRGVEDADKALLWGKREDPRLLYNAARVFALAAALLDADPVAARVQWFARARYQERALRLLREAVELLPDAAERRTFWREQVMGDSALRSLHRSEGYGRLANRYTLPGP